MSIFGTLIFSVVFIVGGYLAYKHLTKPLEEEAEASKEWPSVMGVITASDLHTELSDGQKMYSADIHYSYSVGNKEYYGEGITAVDGGTTSLKQAVKKELKKYPKGKEVTVYYDPEFPQSSVLETGGSFWFWILVKIPFVFMVIGGLSFLSIFKRILRAIFR